MKNKFKCNQLFNKNINKQAGFSLLEVIITLVVSNIAILGLVSGQLKSLQYANNSFQYTVAIIYAKNISERILSDICKLENDVDFDDAYVEGVVEEYEDLGYGSTNATATYQLSWDNTDSPIGSFRGETGNKVFPIIVKWSDQRIGSDDLLNQSILTSSYPTVTTCDD